VEQRGSPRRRRHDTAGALTADVSHGLLTWCHVARADVDRVAIGRGELPCNLAPPTVYGAASVTAPRWRGVVAWVLE
jgi:hypothetical protein